MSISVSCQCGQRFTAPERLAGKTVKCPKCGEPLAIPALPAEAAAVPQAAGGLSDLLDEVGLTGEPTGPACPACRAPIPEGAVLCVACGYHLEKGSSLETKTFGPKKKEFDPTDHIIEKARKELAAEKGIRGFRARRRATRENAGSVVNSGLKTVYYSVVCELLVYAGAFLIVCFGPGGGGGAILVLMGIPAIACFFLAIIGRAHCLFSTPDGSGRGLIVAWFVLIPLSIIGQLVAATEPEIGLILKYSLYYGGVVCWKLYLWRISRFIGRHDIAALALGLAIFQAAAISILGFYTVTTGVDALRYAVGGPSAAAAAAIFLGLLIEEILVALCHFFLLSQLTE